MCCYLLFDGAHISLVVSKTTGECCCSIANVLYSHNHAYTYTCRIITTTQ